MLKNALFLCTLIASFVVVILPINYLIEFIKAHKNGKKMPPLTEFIFGKEPQLIPSIIWTLIVVIGIANNVANRFLSSTEIGSFFEASNYTEYYDAMLTVNEDTSFFCIAEIQKESDPDLGVRYYITSIQLPYGKMDYTDDAEYYPDDDHHSVSVGTEGWSCSIVINSPATENSYTLLENTVVSNYGEFCGSRDSNIFHFTTKCYQARKIDAKNLVYFPDDRVATVLGYEMCERCRDRYY